MKSKSITYGNGYFWFSNKITPNKAEIYSQGSNNREFHYRKLSEINCTYTSFCISNGVKATNAEHLFEIISKSAYFPHAVTCTT